MKVGKYETDFYDFLWLFNIIYTFTYWHGFWHKLFNIFIPYAAVYDLVIKLGKF